MNAIYILWIRQLKRFIRKKASLVGALGQPLIFLIAFGFGLSPVFERAGAGNYIQFISPGIIAMTVMFSAVFSGVEVIWDKQFGFLKETFVAPVSRLQIFIGKTLGGATVAFIQGILVFFIALIIGFRPVSLQMLPLAIFFLALIAIFFSAFGTAIAARLEDMQSFPIIINFVIQPLFYLSGALFPLQGLPVVLRWITSINPLSYGIDGLRYALSGDMVVAPLMAGSVLIGMIAVVTAIGVYQFSRIEL